MSLPEYMAATNASSFIGIQIDTVGALAGAAIAAIPDVDLLFIDPSDLGQVLGVPGDFENSRCLAGIRTAKERYELFFRHSSPISTAVRILFKSLEYHHLRYNTWGRGGDQRGLSFFPGR